MASDADKLLIGNGALSDIGERALAALTDTNDRRVETILAQFERVLDSVVDNHPWAFLSTQADLVLSDTTTGDPLWAKKKAPMPTGSWRVLRIDDSTGAPIKEGWEILGATIYFRNTITAAAIVYTAEKAVSTWPPLFREAVTAALAARLAWSLHRDPVEMQVMEQRALAAAQLARTMESQSQPTKSLRGGRTP